MTCVLKIANVKFDIIVWGFWNIILGYYELKTCQFFPSQYCKHMWYRKISNIEKISD